MPMWFVYVVYSERDERRYVGMSDDPERRLREHNAGHTKSTKGRRPFRIVYQEQFDSPEEAREREKYFKTAAGRRFLRIIGK